MRLKRGHRINGCHSNRFRRYHHRETEILILSLVSKRLKEESLRQKTKKKMKTKKNKEEEEKDKEERSFGWEEQERWVF